MIGKLIGTTYKKEFLFLFILCLQTKNTSSSEVVIIDLRRVFYVGGGACHKGRSHHTM